jgi:ParB family transcriptional regulator, chromosome partitioning protein
MAKKNVNAPAKKKKRSALGRGLDSLIPQTPRTSETASPAYFMCDVDDIRPNRFQPRILFSKDELQELSDSIKTQGIIQPLLVRKDGAGYELVAGERRLRASKMAGLQEVPVVIKKIADKEMLELSIIENIQREDLNPLEEAEAYHRLITEFNITQEEASQRVGKSRSAVTNILRLRQLPEPIKAAILDNLLSMGHARALLGAETAAHQNAALRAIVSKSLSVRQTEALIKRLKASKKPPRAATSNSDEIYFKDFEDKLSRQFGTGVRIKRQGKKGRVEIDFYNDDDLDRLLTLFNKI